MPSPRIERVARTLALALLLWSPACRSVGPPGVTLASEPPGARVFVDGADSGFVTPCILDLSGGLHQVEIELHGYERAVRVFDSDATYWYVPWGDGDVGLSTWPFPLWLGFSELLLPIERSGGSKPRRLFVQLRPEF